MPKNKYFIVFLAIVSSFFSCSKDEEADIKGDPEVKFFMNNTASGDAPQNAIVYSVVNIPDPAGNGYLNLSASIPETIKLAVYASKPVGEDVVIGAELDNTLVGEYNSAHHTNYVAFPAGILNTDGLAAGISKGTTTSADSISIATNLANAGLFTEKAYLAPIKLTTLSKSGVGAITANSTQVAYVVVNVEIRRIKYDAIEADALGSLVSPRTAWDVAISPEPVDDGSIIDGSTSSYTRWNSSPGQVDINLQATTNVTGIRLYTASSSSRLPTKVDLYLSNDGVNYDLIGSPAQGDMTFASSRTYILFYKAIPAQYIRAVLYYSTSTNSQNRRLAEFDVYAN